MSKKIEPISEKEYDELVEKHGQLFEVETSLGKVYVRRATKHEFRRCVKKLRDGNLEGQDQLCVDCALYPNSSTMSKMFDIYPALSAPIAEVLTAIAQGDEESAAKKPSSFTNSDVVTE
jgi:hypothetical protein